MSNNKQSSVDAIIQFMKDNQYFIGNDLYEFFQQAKAMHKEEIIDAWIATDNELQRMAAERYYDETFES